MNAQAWDCTNAEYHADHSKIGASMLKVALRSPSEYKRRFLDDPPLSNPESPSLIVGDAEHVLLLQPDLFDQRYYVRPEGIDSRTTEGKKKLAELRLSSVGKRELTIEQHENIKAMANAVLYEPFLDQIIHDPSTKIEQAVVWEDSGVTCKCRPDLWVPRPDQETDLILDLKTADDPSPEMFGGTSSFSPIRKYRYDMQLAHYVRGISEFTGRHCAAGLIVVGKSDPYDVFIYDITAWLPVGNDFRHKALSVVANGNDTGWRRPEQGVVVALAPSHWDYGE